MSATLGNVIARRHAASEPLEVLRAWRIAHDGDPGAPEVADLARASGLPAATVRAAFAGYADLREPVRPLHVCVGTACTLAAGGAIAQDGNARRVRCLGQCHAGPARMTVADGVAHGPGGRLEPPDVRCVAARPVVTGRLDRARDLAAARAVGVWDAYEAARAGRGEAVLAAVEESGLLGRGGAAFPTGMKWRAAAEVVGDRRFAVANGDEGDPGSFVDRLLMERDPHGVLEGLALCALAIGARSAIVFVRSEYPAAQATMRAAIAEAEGAGLLGPDAGVDVRLVVGLGSYVCGEETALLGAIEGGPPRVRARPPYPTTSGLYGSPTVVDNVETLVAVPWILGQGVEAFRGLGSAAASGTKALSLAAGFARPGVLEIEFGADLGDVIAEAGGEDLRAVLLGGPMGSVLTPQEWDVPVCPAEMRARGVQLGHGGLVPIRRGADLRALALHLAEFMSEESCGTCAPCRIGSELLRQRVQSRAPGIDELADLISASSLCAFGHLMPGPIRRLLDLAEEG